MAKAFSKAAASTLSTGYETLLYDCMCGDATLFQRSDNVEAGWKVVTPILDVWRALPPVSFRTTPQAPGARPMPMLCWKRMAVTGGTCDLAGEQWPRMNRIDGERRCLEVLPDLDSLSQAAASLFARIAHESIEARGRFSVALSGGRTPRAVHRLLVDWTDPPIRWEHVYVFWGDERHVPPNHPDSNYGMARETLLSRV